MLVLVSSAIAGFYHPSDVASLSESFRRSSAMSARDASDAQAGVRAYSAALLELEQNLDLLGKREPRGVRVRHAQLAKQYHRDFATLQAFADDMVTGFDGAFVAALDRALVAHPDAVRCVREVPVGPRLPGVPQRTQPNPECEGDDLNLGLARAIDADAQLRDDLKELLGRKWPPLTLEAEPVEPVGGSDWVSVGAFFKAGMRETLRDIDRKDEEARIPFEAAIEQGVSVEELTKLKGEADKVDAATRRRRAEVAGPVLDRATALLDKEGVGWCVQPPILGGCTGTEVPAQLDALLSDRKVARLMGS